MKLVRFVLVALSLVGVCCSQPDENNPLIGFYEAVMLRAVDEKIGESSIEEKPALNELRGQIEERFKLLGESGELESFEKAGSLDGGELDDDTIRRATDVIESGTVDLAVFKFEPSQDAGNAERKTVRFINNAVKKVSGRVPGSIKDLEQKNGILGWPFPWCLLTSSGC